MERTGSAAHVEVLAQHPALEDFYIEQFYQQLYFNSRGDMLVTTRDKELFRFRRGMVDGCAICSASNSRTMIDMGYSQAQVDNILRPTAAHYSDKELSLIAYADLFTLGNQEPVGPELHQWLRRHYSDPQIMELGVVGAFFVGWQRMLFAFDLTPHEEVCALERPTAAMA